MPGRWVRGEGKKCDQGGPPGKQLHCRVFTTFRILEISYISNVFLGFVCHSKMAPISRNYTKFFLPFFYANLYKISGISRTSATFYTVYKKTIRTFYKKTIRTEPNMMLVMHILKLNRVCSQQNAAPAC